LNLVWYVNRVTTKKTIIIDKLIVLQPETDPGFVGSKDYTVLGALFKKYKIKH
jgi:hypothetical protein